MCSGGGGLKATCQGLLSIGRGGGGFGMEGGRWRIVRPGTRVFLPTSVIRGASVLTWSMPAAEQHEKCNGDGQHDDSEVASFQSCNTLAVQSLVLI
eukprot:982747-Rhodomonas_salina.2